jgi:cell cycle checkpoint control protein RAD9A
MVRDFKAIVAHAETLDTSISAFYSRPNRPMQLSYDSGGLSCQFTLMTHGDFKGSPTTPAAAIAGAPQRAPITDSGTNPRRESNVRAGAVSMPPPSRSATHSFSQDLSRPRTTRLSPPPARINASSESLFLRDDNNDRQWDADRYQDEDEDTLGWDASASAVSSVLRLSTKTLCLQA